MDKRKLISKLITLLLLISLLSVMSLPAIDVFAEKQSEIVCHDEECREVHSHEQIDKNSTDSQNISNTQTMGINLFSAFTPRTSAPSVDNSYYLHTSAGGVNECILIGSGSVLPNCVGYAWGRAYEILGERPNLSRNDAGSWYNYNINNGYYSYGQTPALGAIAVWASTKGGAGHVAVVKEVFELFLQGYGKTAIARTLNEKGIPNPTEYKKQKGLRFKHTSQNENSGLWKYYTIQSMLCNEMYIGTMVQNRQKNASYKSSKTIQIPKEAWIKIPNMHEPIIDMKTWNKAQALIKQRFKPWGDTNKIGIFTKKVKCIYCGYYLRTQKTGNRHNLQCSTSFVSKEACVGCCMDIKKLERIVLSELKSIIEKYEIKDDEIKSKVVFEERLQSELDSLSKNIETYNKKIEECTSAVKNLYLDKVKSLITDDEFVEFSKGFHQDKEKYQNLIQSMQEQANELNLKLMSSLNKEELLNKYRSITQLERIHVDTLIDYIEIGKRIPKTRDREINIYWNF